MKIICSSGMRKSLFNTMGDDKVLKFHTIMITLSLKRVLPSFKHRPSIGTVY